MLMKIPITYEPKINNRFIFRFPDDLGINEWFVEKAARPKITIGTNDIKFLNTSTYVAGSFKWEPISLTLRDPIGPSASQAIMEWVRLCAESVTGRMGYAAGYKRDCWVEMLDPTGVVIEKWNLQGAFITNADFGSLEYGDGALATISIGLQFDRAILLY